MNKKATKETTREKILKAALVLFSTKGYLGTTTREIAREAGVAELTLYRHFKSKEKIFEEVLNSCSCLPVLKEVVPAVCKKPCEIALMEIAKSFLEGLSERRNWIQITHSEVQRYPEKARGIYFALIDEVIGTLSGYFINKQKEGTLASFDPEIGAMAFIGMFYSYFEAQELLMMKDHNDPGQERIVEGFVKLFMNGVKKPSLKKERKK